MSLTPRSLALRYGVAPMNVGRNEWWMLMTGTPSASRKSSERNGHRKFSSAVAPQQFKETSIRGLPSASGWPTLGLAGRRDQFSSGHRGSARRIDLGRVMGLDDLADEPSRALAPTTVAVTLISPAYPEQMLRAADPDFSLECDTQ